jgi:LysR family cyn operon transcriptional activator
LFDKKAREVGVRPKVAVEMNSIEGILATVRNCGGATILPAPALPKKDVSLRAIKITEPRLQRTVGMVWRRNGYRCRAMDAFVEYARAAVAAHAAVSNGGALGRHTQG